MSSNFITSTVDDGVMLLGINRAERKNALTGDMYLTLADALTAADKDPSTRVVVVHGSESAFCAGNDIGDFAAAKPVDGERPSARFMEAVLAIGKPLLGAVNGPAVGIGATMLLHFDMVFVGEGAKLSFPFSKLGLCPEFASTMLMASALGFQRAAEILFLGDPIDAQTARGLGLVNAVLSPAEVLPHARQIARRLCQVSGESLKATKALMRKQGGYRERIQQENKEFSRLMQTPEAQAAFASFLKPARAAGASDTPAIKSTSL